MKNKTCAPIFILALAIAAAISLPAIAADYLIPPGSPTTNGLLLTTLGVNNINNTYQVQARTNSVLIMNASQKPVMSDDLSRMFWSVPKADYALTYAGTGNTVVKDGGSGVIDIDTGGNASSTAVAYSGNFSLDVRGDVGGNISYAQPTLFMIRLDVLAASTHGIVRVSLGKVAADGAGALAKVGYGFVINDLVLKGVCYTGSTLTTVDLATTLTVATTYDLKASDDGNGNIVWYVNGNSVGTSQLGPNTTGSGGMQVEVIDGADTTNNEVTFRPPTLVTLQ